MIHFLSCFMATFIMRVGLASFLHHPQNCVRVEQLLITSNSPQSSQRYSTVTQAEQGGGGQQPPGSGESSDFDVSFLVCIVFAWLVVRVPSCGLLHFRAI